MNEEQRASLQGVVECLADIVNLPDEAFDAFAEEYSAYARAWKANPLNSEFALVLPALED